MSPGPTGRSRRENFTMRESVMREPQVLARKSQLFPCLKSRESKGWVRRVPAAAVIPAARVVAAIIGPKTSVAGLVNAWVNREA